MNMTENRTTDVKLTISHSINNPNLTGFRFVFGQEVSPDQIREALQLDYLCYDDVYHLDLDQCIGYHHKNPYIYFMMLNPKEQVIGYINFSPVTDRLYEILRSGEEVDTIIEAKDIVTYRHGNEYSGYFSSICVHPDYRKRGIDRVLIDKLEEMLGALEKQDVRFKRIVADAVSVPGERICSKLGLSFVCETGHGSKIMEKTYG